MSCNRAKCVLCRERTRRLRLASAAHVCWRDIETDEEWWNVDMCGFIRTERKYFDHVRRPCPWFIKEVERGIVFDLCVYRNHGCALQSYIADELSQWESAPGAPPLWAAQHVPLE